MNPWLAAFFGFCAGGVSGIGFMIWLLMSSHRREIAHVIQSKGK